MGLMYAEVKTVVAGALIHCHSASDSKLVNKKGTTSFWQGASGTLTASACSEEGFGDFDSLVKRNSMLRENGNGSVSARGEDDGPLGSPMSFSGSHVPVGLLVPCCL